MIVTLQEQQDMARLVTAANPADELSFMAAEMIWGSGLRELRNIDDLIKFIGYFSASGRVTYAHHWKDTYLRWAKARAEQHLRSEIRSSWLKETGWELTRETVDKVLGLVP